MKWTLVLLIMLVIVPAAFGQYAFQITTERDAEGYCINGQDITPSVNYHETDGVKTMFPDHPDPIGISDKDLQKWYIDAETQGFYFVNFSFSGVGLTIPKGVKYYQYWFRYARDGGLWSDWNVFVVRKPGKPTGGQ